MLLDYQWDLQDALPPTPEDPSATVAGELRATVVEPEERGGVVREERLSRVP